MALVPGAGCAIQPGYALPNLPERAMAAFMAVLDGHRIAVLRRGGS
jgi:hypothetical protein